ncbi:hypothetical protein C823_003906 [Eubacterium plexicaudatum ASF492]|nr:hypothetical protein C823_003906 [Eubacterium plexicaudatum ASF492]
MSYRKVYEIENEQAKERYELVLERVRQAANQPETQERFADYFERTARFILLTANVLELEQKGMLEHRSMEECERLNRRLYEDILPCVQDGGAEETGGFGYETSYANPAYAVERLGEEFGGALCFCMRNAGL